MGLSQKEEKWVKVQKMMVSMLMILTLLTAAAPYASASMLKLSVEDLTGQADVILIGEVREVVSRLGADRNMVHTYTTLSVDRYIKGDTTEKTVTIITEGGEAGDYGVWVEDMPGFTKNESVLVFLTHRNL